MTAASDAIAGSLAQPRPWKADLAAAAAISGVAYLLYLLFPDNLALFTRIVSVTLLVLSLDLVTGYAGIATLGHAVLFGAGAYAAGIGAVRFGVADPLAMLALGAIAGAIAGTLSSLLIVRGNGLAQLVLSIAILRLTQEAANKAAWLTGGSDGLSGIAPAPVFGLFRFDLFGRTAFVLAVVILIAAFLALRIIVRSPFGMLCRGIREDKVRLRAMGASIFGTLVKAYAISGAIAGLGGALAAINGRVVGLDSLSFNLSAEALVMLVVGGVGNLFGALIGSVVFMWCEHQVSSINPFHWLAIIGTLLILVVLFAPQGLTGAARRLWRSVRGWA